MSTQRRSVAFRSQELGIAAALALGLGACGADDPLLGAGGADSRDKAEHTSVASPARTVDRAGVASGKVATLSSSHKELREELRREASRKMAERAARQVGADRLQMLKPTLQLSDQDTLRPVSVHRRKDGSASVRCDHYHRALPVIGSSAIVHTDANGEITRVTNALDPGIRISTSPDLNARQAAEIVMADPARHSYRQQPVVELAILPLKKQVVKLTGLPPGPNDRNLNAKKLEWRLQGHRLVYVVDTDEENRLAANPIQKMRYLVDAQTRQIVQRYNQANTDDEPDVNTGQSLYDYPNFQGDPPTFSDNVDLDVLYSSPGGSDPYRYIMQDWGRELLVLDNDYDWYEGPNNSWTGLWGDGLPFNGQAGCSPSCLHRQTSIVDAKFALQAVWDMLDEVFDRQGVDDDFFPTDTYVHYGTWWDDAEYAGGDYEIHIGDGPEPAMGQGTDGTRTSLDTVAHEFGHALDHWMANMRSASTQTETRGLAEAHADIMGVMTRYYVYNQGLLSGLDSIPDGDTQIWAGNTFVDYWVLANGRSCKNPKYPYYFSSIGNEDEHDALGPMVRAFYFLAVGATWDTTPGGSTTANPYLFSYLLPWGMDPIGIDKASQIWYTAMADEFPSNSIYSTADASLILAAITLFGEESAEVAAVKNATAAANFSTLDEEYVLPALHTEVGNNNTQANAEVVSKPADPNPLDGKPTRNVVTGNRGTSETVFDWYAISVPNGYGVKVTLIPTWGNDHDMAIFLGSTTTTVIGTAVLADKTSLPGVVRIPYSQNGSGPDTLYTIKVQGYDSGSNGEYRLYIDWLKFCTSSSPAGETFGSNRKMVGCVGSTGNVTWADRATLCSPGTHVCSMQEWLDNREGSTPGHNYWTNNDLRYNAVGGACAVKTSGFTSCGTGNPVRICAGTLPDPESHACNTVTNCTTDPAIFDFFGCGTGDANNTTAGALCCVNN